MQPTEYLSSNMYEVKYQINGIGSFDNMNGADAGAIINGVCVLTKKNNYPVIVQNGAIISLSYTSESQIGQGGTVTSTGSGLQTVWTHLFTVNGVYTA